LISGGFDDPVPPLDATASDRGDRMARIVVLAALLLVAGCANHMSQPQNFTIFFPTGDATLTPEAQKLIVTIAAAHHDMNPSRIAVEGRADGGTTHDADLADQRARVVIKGLVDAGVDATIIDKQPSAPPTGTSGVAAHMVEVRFEP
jgi:outer membrane protein OmpA-like peptidoglycan-associated protein